ncbi:MAG: tyrosine-protein phosphatase [Eubacterium sp.]|nr:tyrosine-protein phosphatase [Eubacterium sp.]
MKKAIALIVVFVLAVGIGFGVNFYHENISAADIEPTPTNNETVPLLGGDIYEFCTHYKKGIINDYYTQYANKYAPKPLSIEWDSVKDATSYAVRLGMKSDLTDSKKYVVMENKLDVEDLLAATNYYFQVTTTVDGNMFSSDIIKITTSDLPRTIYVDSVGNTRDFGGRQTADKKYRVKQGMIYRGANVDKVSSEGKDKLLNEYGIKSDMDLRGKSKVSPLGSNVKCISIAAVQYSWGLSMEDNWDTMKKEVMAFTDINNFPMYMHCAIGRDRTGTLCYLIGALLGMSEQDLCRDYELSFFANVSNADIDNPNKFNQSNLYSMVNYLKNYDKGTLQENTMEYMRECLGIKQTYLNKIRSNLLTPSPKPIPEPTVPRPSKVKLKVVKNVKKKSILVKFKKTTNAKGYQVWCTKKKKTRIGKIKYTTKLKYKFKKLKKKKKYYIKVRAYNINGHTKVFGPFSKTKKVRIRK